MNIVHLKRSDPTVDQIVRAAWPEYNGKHVEAHISETVRFHGAYWDEGHKREYAILRLADMKRVPIPDAPFLDHSELHTKPHKIPDGFVVVVNCMGRYDHIEIISPASNVSNLLPAPAELTDDERTVLIATRSFKSSYGGLPTYRFHEAKRARGITLDRWEAAKASLIAKKLLTKAGAITPEGRNAVGFEQL